MSDMNVSSATSTTSTYTGYQDTTKTKTEDTAKANETKKAEESGAVYEYDCD